MTDHAPIAFIQFSPVASTPIRKRRRISIQVMPSAIEHCCLAGAGTTGDPIMEGKHLGFTPGGHDCAQVIAHHKGSTFLNSFRNIGPFRVCKNRNKLLQRPADFHRAHWPTSITFSAVITSSDGITSAYFPFMSHRFTACEVGARS